MKQSLLTAAALGTAIMVSACATVPEGARVVTGFEAERYLGTWYEIARLDFAFERDLDDTTAQYAALEGGAIAVTNRGYNIKNGAWSEARGRARFRGPASEAALEVSFFGPFYAPYNVIALDPEYRYALVAGSSTKYLWILSREPTIPDDVKAGYLELAASLGYDTGKLVWVRHSSD